MNQASFSIQEVIREGINLFKTHWKKTILAQLVIVALSFALVFLVSLSVYNLGTSPKIASPFLIIGVVAFIVFILALAYMVFGYKRFLFKLASGEENLSISEIFKAPKNRFWQYLWGSIVMGLLILAGFILLIVPGIIVATILSMFTVIFLNSDKSGIESLKESRRITKGHRVNIFLFGLVVGVVSIIIGIVPILGDIVAMFIISPIAFFTFFVIYKKITMSEIKNNGIDTKTSITSQPLELPEE